MRSVTDAFGDALREARRGWTEAGEATLNSGLVYRPGEPVLVRVRKRGHRYDIGDEARAAELAGRPQGWLEVAERVVAEGGLNVSRRGVVFVSAVEGRDIGSLGMKVAEASLAVHAALLEAADAPQFSTK